MTLFDRKVDIARFTEGTTLYVMCREWMKNNLDPDGEHLASDTKDKHLVKVSFGYVQRVVLHFCCNGILVSGWYHNYCISYI